MIYQATFPAELGQLEYVRLYLHLQMAEGAALPQGALLQLRRELLGALKLFEAELGADDCQALRRALQPQVQQDAVLRRHVQKVGATLILAPEAIAEQCLVADSMVCLPILFLGDSMQIVPLFLVLIDRLGELGLHKGMGRYALVAIEGEDASGYRSSLWHQGEDRMLLAPPQSDLGWWLELQGLAKKRMTIEFLTPARLLSQGKPLFRPDFAALFPFILRRVGQVLGQHLKTNLIENPDALIERAGGLEQLDNRLVWQDWRILERNPGKQELGGIVGSLTLKGEGLGELFWILKLGCLFNVGKGSSFGFGQYRFIEA
jgi:hypothetical protein